MAAETITQIRANYPGVTLANTDLFLLDQTNRTIAATIAELAAFVRPAVATSTTPGLMSAADKTKLNSVPSNATANSSDSFLLNRENHQGQQGIATVSGLGPRLATIESTAQSHASAIEALQNENPEVAIAALQVRVGSVETRTGVTESRIGTAEGKITTVENRIGTAENRITDVEDWSDAAEIRIVGLESDVAALKAPKALILPTFTLAGLPPAATNNRAIVEVSNATGGPTVVRSNGTSWMILNTTTEVE